MLRAGEAPDAAVWPGDDDPRSGHYVVRRDGRVLGVGSVIPQDDGSWRVRGMATEPAARGQGVGAEVLAALIDHARGRGATLLWCNARPRATPLYARAGFVAVGDPWDDPHLGPHQRMELRLA